MPPPELCYLLLTCEDTQNASATPNIQNNLVLEQMFILHDSILICFGTDGVLQHFLVDGEVGVAIEVVIRVFDVPEGWLSLSSLSLHLLL